MRFIAALLVLASLAVAGAQDLKVAGSTGPDAQLQEELGRLGAPGAAIAVVRGERVTYLRGFGSASVETGAPVAPDTLFQIGSATKMLTAAAVMSAHAGEGPRRGRAGVAVCQRVDRVRRSADGASAAVAHRRPDGRAGRVRAAGRRGTRGLSAHVDRRGTCLLPPGRAFSYSNSGFALAGLALQEAEQKPFADVVKARVLEPLGMTRTTFRPTEAMTWPLAIGHRRDQAGAFSAVRPLPNDARLWPAGTVYSSAQEMARLVVALLNDGRVEGKQALPAGLAATLRTPVAAIPTTGERYGLGQFLTERTFGHGGTMTGYTAQVTIDHTAGVGVVVLGNGDNASLTPIVQTLLRAAGVAPAVAPVAPAAAGGVLSSLDAYVGTYRNPRRFTVEVVRSGDGLVLRRFGRDFPLRRSGADTFVTDLPRGGTETIAFGRGAGGRADYLQMNVWALARVP